MLLKWSINPVTQGCVYNRKFLLFKPFILLASFLSGMCTLVFELLLFAFQITCQLTKFIEDTVHRLNNTGLQDLLKCLLDLPLCKVTFSKKAQESLSISGMTQVLEVHHKLKDFTKTTIVEW